MFLRNNFVITLAFALCMVNIFSESSHAKFIVGYFLLNFPLEDIVEVNYCLEFVHCLFSEEFCQCCYCGNLVPS